MKIIRSNHLSQITGGAAVAPWSLSNDNHFAGLTARPAINFQQSTKANMASNEYDPAATHCSCTDVFISPKNGDRNALGQQYSWGTWWDDMN